MYISNEYFVVINIIAIIAITLAILVGYKKGMVYEVLSLCSFFLAILLAYILSPIFAQHFVLFESGNDLTSIFMNGIINHIVWFLIIVVGVKLIFAIILPLTSIISKLPLIGFINKIGGALVGIFNGFVWVLLLSLILSTPLFKNGNEIKENTIIKHVNVLSDNVLTTLIENFGDTNIKEELESQGINIDEIRNNLEDWLIDKGALSK